MWRAILMLVGCGSSSSGAPDSRGLDATTGIVLTVDRRPAVHGATALTITVSENGQTSSHVHAVSQFPTVLEVPRLLDSTTTISVVGTGANNQAIATGATLVPPTVTTALVMLEPNDFVINSEYEGGQFLTTDYEAVGSQIAVLSTGEWTTAFRDECTSCNIYARRFGSAGLPLTSLLAGSENQFPVSTEVSTTGAMPAVATSFAATLVFWDFTQTVGGARGVKCRALDQSGNSASAELVIATDPADVVSATGLSNGSFAVVWQTFQSTSPATYVVRSTIVKPDCTLLANVQTLTPPPGSTGQFGATRAHVASNAQTILYAWIVDGDLRIRTSNLSGALGPEATLVSKTSVQEIEHVRLASWGTDFAVIVRWASTNTTGPGKIVVYRTSQTGQLIGTPTSITSQSRSDFASNHAFGVASRSSDQALLIAWHVCEIDSQCDVFGRVVHRTGVPVGEPFMIPTTTTADQTQPSVAALADAFVAVWNDASETLPDRSGLAVRGRVLYPNLNGTESMLGSPCGSSLAACGPALVCAPGSDSVSRCYELCTTSCPTGGVCTVIDVSTSACIF